MSLFLEKWERVAGQGSSQCKRAGPGRAQWVGGDTKEDVAGEGPGSEERSEDVLRALVSQPLELGRFLGFQAGV